MPSERVKRSRRKASAKWKQKNPERAKAITKNSLLKRRFGITLEEYDSMWAAQKGLCAICDEPETAPDAHNPNIARRLAVDHCHQTNKIRGLLCSSCNMGIVQFEDKPSLLVRAKEYLEKFKWIR